MCKGRNTSTRSSNNLYNRVARLGEDKRIDINRISRCVIGLGDSNSIRLRYIKPITAKKDGLRPGLYRPKRIRLHCYQATALGSESDRDEGR